MSGQSGNQSRETSGLSGKQIYMLPSGSDIVVNRHNEYQITLPLLHAVWFMDAELNGDFFATQ